MIELLYTVTMLRLSNTILGCGVFSLRTGKPVATVVAPIFNPKNLKVEGFYCTDSIDKSELILVEQDIRETIQNGFVIDDHDVLVEPDDLVRLRDVLNLRFELIGKHVETMSKDKVGKVSDYAIETDTMYVQKLYASQSILKSLTGGSLSIDRMQINEITNKRIVINDLLQNSKVPAPAAIA